MTKQIPLTQGKVALVDDEDFERVNQFKWQANHKQAGKWYAVRSIPVSERPARKKIQEKMHQLILNAPNGVLVDHKNGDGLDNRKQNLRFCTNAENQHNQSRAYGASGYKGVTNMARRSGYHKYPWQAGITINKKFKYLGNYATAEEAARAYDAAARKYWGEFAHPNFPD